jgi:TatD DNase family protein
MNYFDAHTHTNFVAYDADRDAVFVRAREAQVGMNVVGTQLDTSRDAIALAEKYDNVWATIGLHPVHTAKSYHDTKELGTGGKEFTSRGEIFDFAAYESLGKNPKVIAIGECGLDYYRLDADTKKIQQDAFVQQIELANTLGKPLMLHIRNGTDTSENAYLDSIEILKAHTKAMYISLRGIGILRNNSLILDLRFHLRVCLPLRMITTRWCAIHP